MLFGMGSTLVPLHPLRWKKQVLFRYVGWWAPISRYSPLRTPRHSSRNAAIRSSPDCAKLVRPSRHLRKTPRNIRRSPATRATEQPAPAASAPSTATRSTHLVWRTTRLATFSLAQTTIRGSAARRAEFHPIDAFIQDSAGNAAAQGACIAPPNGWPHLCRPVSLIAPIQQVAHFVIKCIADGEGGVSTVSTVPSILTHSASSLRAGRSTGSPESRTTASA